MPEDNKQVVQGQNSEETKPKDNVQGGEIPPKELSQDEKIAELVRQQVQAEIARQTELSKREIQSAKDKARKEVEEARRRAMSAEGVLTSTRTQLRESDPEIATNLELAELRARDAVRARQEQEETLQRQREEFNAQFRGNLENLADSLGIDKKDPGLDWGEDAPNYLEAMKRFNASAVAIRKAKDVKAEKEMEDRITAKLRKDLDIDKTEANSVSASMSSGISTSGGMPTDIEAFRKWIADLPQAEYEKNQKAIDERYRELRNK